MLWWQTQARRIAEHVYSLRAFFSCPHIKSTNIDGVSYRDRTSQLCYTLYNTYMRIVEQQQRSQKSQERGAGGSPCRSARCPRTSLSFPKREIPMTMKQPVDLALVKAYLHELQLALANDQPQHAELLLTHILQLIDRCKNTILCEHYALLSTRFLSREVESEDSREFF